MTSRLIDRFKAKTEAEMLALQGRLSSLEAQMKSGISTGDDLYIIMEGWKDDEQHYYQPIGAFWNLDTAFTVAHGRACQYQTRRYMVYRLEMNIVFDEDSVADQCGSFSWDPKSGSQS